MEKNKERVLAYSLAKVISFEDLAAVSGGGLVVVVKPRGLRGKVGRILMFVLMSMLIGKWL